MKILLIGEYSRLHNSLKEGLIKLGHNVTLLGTEDGFKNFPVDINVSSKLSKNKVLKKIAKVIDKLFGINLIQIENAYRFNKALPDLKGFDTVQLINESCIKTSISTEIKLLKKLFSEHKNVYLLSCGIDHVSVKYAYEKKFKYSILTPLHKDSSLKSYYRFILNKLKPESIKLHDFLFKNVKGVIASDLDYHLPHLEYSNYLGLIPNPINVDILKYIPIHITDKIIIFHGVNAQNYIKKGNQFFDDALDIIKTKYADKVHVIRSENIAYNEYIKLYNSCHILLDQVYAYDQGYNALEAMAKGKVVFTGAEQEWLDYYNLKEDTVAINALPDSNKIASKLEWLILNPEHIISISKNARNFIEKEHDYIEIAKKYVKLWTTH